MNDLYVLGRLISEIQELDDKLLKAKTFIEEVHGGVRPEQLGKAFDLLKIQVTHMMDYRDVLKYRIDLLGREIFNANKNKNN